MRDPSYRRRHGCLLLLPLKLLVVYMLSFGPVHALYSSHRLEGSMAGGLAAFYQPLQWLREQTPLGKPMAAYDDWWQRLLAR